MTETERDCTAWAEKRAARRASAFFREARRAARVRRQVAIAAAYDVCTAEIQAALDEFNKTDTAQLTIDEVNT